VYYFNIGGANSQLTAAKLALTLVLDESEDKTLVLDQIVIFRSNSVLTRFKFFTLVLD